MPRKKRRSGRDHHADWTALEDCALPKGARAKLQRLVGPKACKQIELAYKEYIFLAASENIEPGERDIARELSGLAKWAETGQEMLSQIEPATVDRMESIGPSIIDASTLRRNFAEFLWRFDNIILLALDGIRPRRGRAVKFLERNFAARIAGIMIENNLPLSATKGIDAVSGDSLFVEILYIILDRNQPELARYAVKNPSVG